ncbi:OmpA family protein [Algiphilus sp. NNCM1]|uniref:OmpA family protein n=1 Tax=Algiphilus sp. TaxID=1872431 RepID=UPI001CA72B40|nr:OmpA family protein [Algiphilus sp.]MBY8966172.1 OmpA family protein [Algiphilus acroporae]MCI5061674.1 OmpA family protein [Algiphilus sp.]MCI5103877.1 OmpA family protein [Algiphilus sp.]
MNNRFFVALCGVGAMLAPAMAPGSDEGALKAFGSLSYQHVFDSNDRPAEDGMGGQLSLGYFFHDNFAVEAAFDYTQYDADDALAGNRDMESYYYKLGAMFFPARDGMFDPYISIGGGLADNRIDPPSERRRRAFGEAAVGGLFFTSSALPLRLEAVYRHTDGIPAITPGTARTSANEALIRVGLALPILREAVPAPEPTPSPTETVEDLDGDGVPDNLDECPSTEEGVRVNARGCPIDSDADGVADYIDECPGTAAGVQVDDAGCPVQVAIDRKFEDINFGFDKFNLTDYAKSTLDKTAAEIRQLIAENQGVQVNLEGHTDSIGTTQYNEQLGQKRANVVRDYLVEKGVGAARITTRSAGELQPIATNETDKGRLLNRRVEIRARSAGE